jgi:hypothetical protein
MRWITTPNFSRSREHRLARSILITLWSILAFSAGFAQTQSTPTDPLAAPIGWPPKLEVNQTWIISIDGLGAWELNLTGLDTDGDTVGTARAQTKDATNLQAFFYFKRADDQAYLALTDTVTTTLCTFDPRSVKGETMFGATFTRTKTDAGFKPVENVCSATLVAQTGPNPNPPSSTPNTPPPSATNPPANPTPTAPSSAAAWPPRIAVGQIWTVDLGSTRYDLALTRAVNNGASGPATTPKIRADAVFSYDPKTNRATLEIAGAATIQVCTFDAKSLKGTGYVGTAAYKTSKNGPLKPINGLCIATLLKPGTSRTLNPLWTLENTLMAFPLL